jgi:RNA polymerase sigma factor (TIGR02999 family)
MLRELYDELRGLAARKLAAERPGVTLSPTVLVHEAWLRLGAGGEACGEERRWEGRGHFYAAAAETMRRILIDRARRRAAARHGGGLRRTEFDQVECPASLRVEELLAVDEALDALAGEYPRKAEVVKLRYFVGLGVAEIAPLLGVSVATVERDWGFARAWLFRALSEKDGG